MAYWGYGGEFAKLDTATVTPLFDQLFELDGDALLDRPRHHGHVRPPRSASHRSAPPAAAHGGGECPQADEAARLPEGRASLRADDRLAAQKRAGTTRMRASSRPRLRSVSRMTSTRTPATLSSRCCPSCFPSLRPSSGRRSARPS